MTTLAWICSQYYNPTYCDDNHYAMNTSQNTLYFIDTAKAWMRVERPKNKSLLVSKACLDKSASPEQLIANANLLGQARTQLVTKQKQLIIIILLCTMSLQDMGGHGSPQIPILCSSKQCFSFYYPTHSLFCHLFTQVNR